MAVKLRKKGELLIIKTLVYANKNRAKSQRFFKDLVFIEVDKLKIFGERIQIYKGFNLISLDNRRRKHKQLIGKM
mgnify:FL=1